MTLTKIQKHLFDIRSDPDYRALQQKIITTVDPETIIGIRTPDVKKYAKGADLKSGLSITGSMAADSKKAVEQWFKSNGIM